MANQTFPNQRTIITHRERATANFLGIKNENWQAASRDLGAHALQLYLYIASNANNYNLSLSPVAVRQAIGMARSTYHDQFHKLVDKGYLVPKHGNTFDFYEVPRAATHIGNNIPTDGLDFEENPVSSSCIASGGQNISPEDIEINNIYINKNTSINSQEAFSPSVPKVETITIQKPIAEGSKRPIHKRKEFNF